MIRTRRAAERKVCSGFPNRSCLGRSGLGKSAGLLLLEKTDADLFALNPGELAPAIGKASRRQQQEEFLQVQTFDRPLDRKFCAGLGDVLHHAVAPPSAVDSHHVRVDAALEGDAVALAPFRW